MRFLLRDRTMELGPVIVTEEEMQQYMDDNQGHNIDCEAIVDMASDNTPDYYKLPKGLDVYDLLATEEKVGFCKGNVLKYTIRAGRKPGNPAAKDLKKAKDNLEKWLEVLGNERC